MVVFLYSMIMNLDQLKDSLVGSVYNDSEFLSHYSADKSYLDPVLPSLVIVPECEADIEYVLAYANANNQPITVRGGGSGKSGGAIPEPNGIVISFEKMTAISTVDIANRCVVVQPGAILDDIKHAVEEQGLWYPIDPSSSDWCTIGGNVAENAGGANALKYGVTGDYILAVSGFFGNGNPFSFGRKCHKDVAGYDIKSLLIGSEGTLGIITSITLKLIPKPRFSQSFWCSFSSLQAICQFFQTLSVSSYQLSAAECIQPACLAAVASYLDEDISFLNGPALLCRYESDSQEGLDQFRDALLEQCDVFDASCHMESDDLYWLVRRSISDALGDRYRHKFSEDITVPSGVVKDYLNYIPTLAIKGTVIVCYGHLGDGNIHTNILNESLSEEDWVVAKRTMIDQIMAYAVELGGTLTGEHGIGLTKKDYMDSYFSEYELAILKGVKRLFDPNTILNPSKLF